jgi:small subunit ribosomal protein S14
MAKVSAVNKNDKRIKLSDRLYKKRRKSKKRLLWIKNYH